MSQKVALDIDDILAGFYTGVCKLYNRPETQCNIWDGTEGGACQWIAELMAAGELDNDPEFWIDLPVISDPRTITFEVAAYITSSPESMLAVREMWLVQNGFPIAPVLHCKDKLSTMTELGIDILVDDSPRTFKHVNQEGSGKVCIQFVPSYMNHVVNGSMAITHLSQVNKFIQLIEHRIQSAQ